MAEQDVHVKEVDVIRVYNQKFGEFYVSYSEHMQQLLHALQEKLESLQQIKHDIKKERGVIDEEIKHAHQKWHEASNGSTGPNYEHVRQAREEYEHLSGNVYHKAKNCEELTHHKLMQATESINMIEQRTKKMVTVFQDYVERGRQYLDKVEQYIDQYKETNLNT